MHPSTSRVNRKGIRDWIKLCHYSCRGENPCCAHICILLELAQAGIQNLLCKEFLLSCHTLLYVLLLCSLTTSFFIHILTGAMGSLCFVAGPLTLCRPASWSTWLPHVQGRLALKEEQLVTLQNAHMRGEAIQCSCPNGTFWYTGAETDLGPIPWPLRKHSSISQRWGTLLVAVYTDYTTYPSSCIRNVAAADLGVGHLLLPCPSSYWKGGIDGRGGISVVLSLTEQQLGRWTVLNPHCYFWAPTSANRFSSSILNLGQFSLLDLYE